MNRKKRRKPEPNEVDEGSAESFPASDPPSYMGSTAVAGAPEHDRARKPEAEPTVIKERKSVDLNTASAEELGSLPALSPDMVRVLIDHRPIANWDDVRRLPGFDDDTVEKLQTGGAQLGG